jgi:hypothetical protein
MSDSSTLLVDVPYFNNVKINPHHIINITYTKGYRFGRKRTCSIKHKQPQFESSNSFWQKACVKIKTCSGDLEFICRSNNHAQFVYIELVNYFNKISKI